MYRFRARSRRQKIITPVTATRGDPKAARFYFPPKKPAMIFPPPEFQKFPPRPKPCTPSRARRIRRQCLPKPTRGFAAGPAGRCADQKYVFPSPRCRSRSTNNFLGNNVPANDRRPARTTSRRFPLAHRRRECCCRLRPAKTIEHDHSRKISAIRSRAKPLPIAPRSNSSFPPSQRMENCSRSKVHCGWAGCDCRAAAVDGKRAVRGQLHFLCDFKARKNRFGQRAGLSRAQAARSAEISLFARKRLRSDSSRSVSANAACAVCAA